MKLWKISQANFGWDTYIGAVVAASSEDEARNIHPNIDYIPNCSSSFEDNWTKPKDVIVQYLGEAAEGISKGVIIAENIGS